MNNVQLVGRITKDIELKQTQGGKAYCNFTLAISREFNKEEADFINCIAWEKKAETLRDVETKERECKKLNKTWSDWTTDRQQIRFDQYGSYLYGSITLVHPKSSQHPVDFTCYRSNVVSPGQFPYNY